MLGIFGITFPIFALIGLGYVVTRYEVFKASDTRVLGKYVMNIALPGLLFNTVATRPITDVINPGYMLAFALGGFATLLLVFGFLGLTRTGPNRRAIAAMGSTCPNSGFVGYPILLLAYPDLAGVALAMNFLVENILIIPACLILIELAHSGGESSSVGRRIAGAFGTLLRRPFVIGLIVGLAVSAAGLPVPEPLTRLTGMLAVSAAPVALVVIGGSLVGLSPKGNLLLAAQIVVGKLVIHPLVTAGIALILMSAGLSISPDMWAILILTTSMPMFTTWVVIAQESGHEGLASLALLGATAMSFVSLSVVLAIVS
ncbi:AEC family transporter [Actibacterium pelagium]|uniref:Malate transporter n=1 Tax=Actibacterium pelagium TaxID=2029103 RepID=A0A917AHA1_9RHOB|nr:AEC family transporter [Actibacterium pelagium]GGE51838.1 malate transporter [Actibacterium pelagium]